jgi:hypothetical protein
MQPASITLVNTRENQELCRHIRDLHKKKKQPLTIRFSEGLTHIVLEADCLYLPDQHQLGRDTVIDGYVKKCSRHYEIHPRGKGKTINLHLDSELVAELEQIRTRVTSKTQHEVILELFIRGIRAFQAEQEHEKEKQ